MTIEFGIPGHCVEVRCSSSIGTSKKLLMRGATELAYGFDFDPAPGIEKQVGTRTRTETKIEYEVDACLKEKSLCLPAFTHDKCTNFVFYCHSPDTQSQIHKDNYECFLKHAWPEARDDPCFLVCIMHNVETDFGFSWLSDNTIIIRRPNLGLDFGAFTDALHFTSLDKKCLEEKQFFVFFNSIIADYQRKICFLHNVLLNRKKVI